MLLKRIDIVNNLLTDIFTDECKESIEMRNYYMKLSAKDFIKETEITTLTILNENTFAVNYSSKINYNHF
jgi:hypothetical protein